MNLDEAYELIGQMERVKAELLDRIRDNEPEEMIDDVGNDFDG